MTLSLIYVVGMLATTCYLLCDKDWRLSIRTSSRDSDFEPTSMLWILSLGTGLVWPVFWLFFLHNPGAQK